MIDEATRQQIRRARSKFAAMAATYSLGVFNDQFFKQAAMLLAVSAGRESLQGWAIVLFTVPYIVLAAPAGWLADRFAKRHVVIGTKGLELAAMVVGAVGIVAGSWPLILLMVMTMGLQSAIFGPSLNGSIPELYPASYVTTANGLLKVVTTTAILTGVAAAGLVLQWRGRAGVAATALGVAVLGVAGSFGVPRRPAAAPRTPFPWAGPLWTVRRLLALRTDGLLAVTILADAFVWFVGALQIPILNVLGERQLGWGHAATSLLIAAEMAGVAVGGLLSGRLARGQGWHRVLPPAAAAMGLLMLGVWGAAYLPESVRMGCLLASLAGAGLAGGLFMIPCEAFIQVRPAAGEKGAVISSANLAIFLGILASGPLANLLYGVMPPAACFAVLGCFCLAVAVVLRGVLRGFQGLNSADAQCRMSNVE